MRVADLERNKKLACDFLELAFNEKRLDEAIERYLAPTYTQHNPLAPDGPEGLRAFGGGLLAQFPDFRLEIKRVIAEGDLVAVHAFFRTAADDRGGVGVDIFRIEGGRLAEHWDVGQAIPEASANDNGMI